MEAINEEINEVSKRIEYYLRCVQQGLDKDTSQIMLKCLMKYRDLLCNELSSSLLIA